VEIFEPDVILCNDGRQFVRQLGAYWLAVNESGPLRAHGA
jgi:hypothetical protein